MDIITLFVLAVGLSMDALAVAICKGLALRKWKFRNAVIVGLWFGGFQALMPVFGYILGSQFAGRIQKIDHWIAFVLLTLIGANMIREALGEDGNEESEEAPCETDSLSFKSMLLLAIATSIDALAVGVTFAFLKVNIIMAASFIGVTTFIISAVGVYIGCRFGSKFESKAELSGGIILILLGIKILLEHLGILL